MARTPSGSSTRPLFQCSKSKTRIPAVSLTVTSHDHRMHSSSSDQTWCSERQFLHRSRLVRCGRDFSTHFGGSNDHEQIILQSPRSLVSAGAPYLPGSANVGKKRPQKPRHCIRRCTQTTAMLPSTARTRRRSDPSRSRETKSVRWILRGYCSKATLART